MDSIMDWEQIQAKTKRFIGGGPVTGARRAVRLSCAGGRLSMGPNVTPWMSQEPAARGAATFLVSLVSIGTDTAALAAQKETFEAGGVNLP